MPENPLKVMTKPERWMSSRVNYRQEAQTKFDHLWKTNPEQFYPTRNITEEQRIERTLELIDKHTTLVGKKVVDLGCGTGTLSRSLRDKGAIVDAVDISAMPLESLQNEKDINPMQDYVPRTKLPDDTYDLVVATELIAYLHTDEHRLFFAELSRLVKPNGYVVCSTPLDINSEDALQRFGFLSETEFVIDDWVLSYHKTWIRLHDFFAAPQRFVKAYQDKPYCIEKLNQRQGFSKFWFKINACSPLAYLWKAVAFLTTPINRYVTYNSTFANFLEKICHSFGYMSGVSHAIWIGKRRPLVEHTPLKEQPEERKSKRQVWE